MRRVLGTLLAALFFFTSPALTQMQVDTTTPRTPQQITKYAQDWDRAVGSIDSLTAATMKSDTLLLSENTGGTAYVFPHAGVKNEPLFKVHASWGRQLSVQEGVFYYVGGILVHARFAEGISGRPLSWQTLYFAPNGSLVRWVRTDGTVMNRGTTAREFSDIEQRVRDWGHDTYLFVTANAKPPFARETPPPATDATASMKSDLRNLAVAQEAFFADSMVYAANIGAPPMRFPWSRGNRLLAIEASGTGWTARVGGSGGTCAMFVGAIKPLAPATVEGEPACTAR